MKIYCIDRSSPKQESQLITDLPICNNFPLYTHVWRGKKKPKLTAQKFVVNMKLVNICAYLEPKDYGPDKT